MCVYRFMFFTNIDFMWYKDKAVIGITHFHYKDISMHLDFDGFVTSILSFRPLWILKIEEQQITFWNLCLSVTYNIWICSVDDVSSDNHEIEQCIHTTPHFETPCREIKQCWSKKLFVNEIYWKKRRRKRDLSETDYISR